MLKYSFVCTFRGLAMSTYTLDELDKHSDHGDVSYYLCFYLSNPNTKLRAEQILQKGRISAALAWLRSIDEKNACVITTKEERVRKAQAYASLAKIDIEMLAKEHGLEHLLK